MTEKFADVLTFIWGCVLAAAIGCAAYPHSALSAPVPIWAAFNLENSELPDDRADQHATVASRMSSRGRRSSRPASRIASRSGKLRRRACRRSSRPSCFLLGYAIGRPASSQKHTSGCTSRTTSRSSGRDCKRSSASLILGKMAKVCLLIPFPIGALARERAHASSHETAARTGRTGAGKTLLARFWRRFLACRSQKRPPVSYASHRPIGTSIATTSRRAAPSKISDRVRTFRMRCRPPQ